MEKLDIDINNVPNHIAIILDGNGRWAKERLLPRTLGHRAGAFNIVKITKHCNSLGVKALTCFCFSTENWKRPSSEVSYLMKTPVKYYRRYKEKIIKSNVVMRFIGRRDRIPSDLLEDMIELEEKTKNNTGIILTLAIDYGSYDELTTVFKKLGLKLLDKEISIDDINPELIEENLFTSNLPKLDLLIRTSGEVRISNFLLWQLGYAELYFTDVYWPAFNEQELEKAIVNYQSRNRRFGGLKENK